MQLMTGRRLLNLSNSIHDARIQYYHDKQDACIEDLTKAHLKLYEEFRGRGFEDNEELELFHKIYMMIKNVLQNDGLV